MSILRLKIEIPFAFYYSVFDKKITDCPKEEKDSPFLKRVDFIFFVLFTAGYNLHENCNVVNNFEEFFRSFL